MFAKFVESDEVAYIDELNSKLVVNKLAATLEAYRECELPNACNVTVLRTGVNFKRYILIGYNDGTVEVYDA